MQEMFRTSLMPGVSLTCIQTNKFKSSQWYLGLALPLEEKNAALNALLPRVLRRGTADNPDQQSLAAALDELYGGVIEATVSKRGEVQCVGFSAAFLDDELVPEGTEVLDRAAHLLGDLLLRPATRNGRLRSDYVESEKQNLIRDIQRTVNDKAYYALQQAIGKMCVGEAYRVGRYGTLREAKKLSVARLNQHYHKLLSTARVEVYYAGSASPVRVEQAWREALMDLPRQRDILEPHTDWLVQPKKVREFSERMEVHQGRLVMGLRTGCGLNSPRYPALVVANALLGGAPTSRLFLNVREKRSLCYSVSSVLDRHKGLMLVQAGLEPKDFPLAREEILSQLEQLREGAFSDEELQAARQYTANQYRRIPDSQPLQVDYWLHQAMAELRISPEELAQALDSVTREQVLRALSRVTLDSIYTLQSPEKEEETQ